MEQATFAQLLNPATTITHKILFVDDEPDLEMLMRQRFKKDVAEGRFTLSFALNGNDALKLLIQEKDICMLVTDINMPGMDGLTLLGKVNELNRPMKSVVVSAYGDLKNIRSAMNAGAFDFVTKPIDMADLATTLTKTIREVDFIFENQRNIIALDIERAEKQKAQEKNLENAEAIARLISEQNIELERKVKERTLELLAEKETTEKLLLNILPKSIADELRTYGKVKPCVHDAVSIIFLDIVEFTKLAESMSSENLIEELDFYYKAFDTIFEKHKIEKIKTIGDAYLAVCGLPTPNELHAENALLACSEILEFVNMQACERSIAAKPYFNIRVGIHCGTVVAGVVGNTKFSFDIWGDTVNVAARMESCGESGKINISDNLYQLVKDLPQLKFIARGNVDVKNKGAMEMYFVEM